MLRNASNKISIWAEVILFAGIALSIVAGFFVIWFGSQTPVVQYTSYHTGAIRVSAAASGTSNALSIIVGFLVILLGSLFSWLAALLLKAFGELTADTKAIRRRLEWTPVQVKAEATVEEVPVEAEVVETPVPEKPKKARAAKDEEPKSEVTADAPAEDMGEEPADE